MSKYHIIKEIHSRDITILIVLVTGLYDCALLQLSSLLYMKIPNFLNTKFVKIFANNNIIWLTHAFCIKSMVPRPSYNLKV